MNIPSLLAVQNRVEYPCKQVGEVEDVGSGCCAWSSYDSLHFQGEMETDSFEKRSFICDGFFFRDGPSRRLVWHCIMLRGRDRKAEHAPCANCYGVSESEAFPVFTVLFDACIVTFWHRRPLPPVRPFRYYRGDGAFQPSASW